MRLSYKIFMTLCLVLFSAAIQAQEQAPIATSKPDTGIVYFLRSYNLWIHDLKSGQDRQITHDKKISTYTVSHSGNQIAYVINGEQLYILDLIESKETFLFKKTALADPSFSPKDNQLVFTSSVPDDRYFLSNTFGFVYHVWLLDVHTKKVTDLTAESPYHHISANWSPDGKWISYSAMVDPWWTMFKDTPWEIYLMNINDKKDLAIKIGKGMNPKWVDYNRIAVLENGGLKMYDIQTKRVIKEFLLDESCGPNFSLGPSIDTIFYITFCGHEERRTGLIKFDSRSRKKSEIVYDAEDPTYVK